MRLRTAGYVTRLCESDQKYVLVGVVCGKIPYQIPVIKRNDKDSA